LNTISAKAIGNRLAQLRGSRTQAEVAEALGITVSALSNYETGRRIPRDSVKIRIADYYKKPIHKIFYM
jgi:transcriptional regulator with XRE-family HTH domain